MTIKKYLLLQTIILLLFSSPAYSLEQKYHPLVQKIKNAVNNKQVLSYLIEYPLGRENPIPNINTRTEFISRYHQVFDVNLINLIKNSDINSDWDSVGWRGISFNNGTLWLTDTGKIRALNYQSEAEKKLFKQMVNQGKKKLHPSLRVYDKPVLRWQTKNYVIRIDQLNNKKYRYAAWYTGNKQIKKPNIILNNGQLVFDGSGGNHQYTFKNGRYSFVCRVNSMGDSSTPPGSIQVFKDNKSILYQAVIKVLNP